MNQQRRARLFVSDSDQREALTSPARLEVLEQLTAIGPATVRELAERMGRSTHALYYHIRLLADVGLIRSVDTVKRGPRDQTVFDVVANRFELDPAEAKSDDAEPEARTVRAILRKAEREFTSILETDMRRLDSDDCLAARLRARFSAGARRQLRTHLRAILKLFEEEMRKDHAPQSRLETVTLTVVLTPHVDPET